MSLVSFPEEKSLQKSKGIKKASYFYEAFVIKKRQRLTLPGFTLVPSALVGLTALFGMGRGDPHRYSHLKLLQVLVLLFEPVNPVHPPILQSWLISLTCLIKE